jgi:hypothetical protein
MTTKPKGPPYFFIQTGVGNIILRVRDPITGSGTPLTLHQIVSLDVPLNEIPHFDPVAFRQFYGNGEGQRSALSYLFRHGDLEKNFLKCAPGMNDL